MVERRVVVRNAAGVHGHVRVAVALDGSSVSLHRPQEVRLRSERETRGVVHVANTVEAWLKLWMGDHSYAVIAGSSQRHPVIGAIAAPRPAGVEELALAPAGALRTSAVVALATSLAIALEHRCSRVTSPPAAR
jgi:hypothetical protein